MLVRLHQTALAGSGGEGGMGVVAGFAQPLEGATQGGGGSLCSLVVIQIL